MEPGFSRIRTSVRCVGGIRPSRIHRLEEEVLMADSSLLGRVLWYELLTSDVDAAEKFYTAVVGWATAPFEGSQQRYDMWMRAGSVPVGGVMSIPEGMGFPPHWAGLPSRHEWHCPHGVIAPAITRWPSS